MRPVIVSVKRSVKPPELYWTETFNWTVEPNKSPSEVAFCICWKETVIFTLSTFVLVICLVTGELAVTTTPTGVIDELLSIPSIFVWFEVPKREVKVTFWKLKSESAGLEELAVDYKTGVSFKKTSFK